MKIQNINLALQFNKKNTKNINFKAQEKKINKGTNLPDVFKRVSLNENGNITQDVDRNPVEIKYYFIDKNDKAVEAFMPVISENTPNGIRVFAIKNGKKYPYMGFSNEKPNNNTTISSMYVGGYPFAKDTYQDGELIETVTYDKKHHKPFLIKKDGFSIQKSDSPISVGVSMEKEYPDKTVFVRMDTPKYGKTINMAEVIVTDKTEEHNILKREVMSWDDENIRLGNYDYPDNLESLKILKDGLNDLRKTIRDNEYKNDFGKHYQINFQLYQAIKFINKKLEEYKQ